jgi:TldD protein
VDPFEVDEATKTSRVLGLNETLLTAPGVNHAQAMLGYVHENKYFANLAGTSTTQQRVRIQANLTAVSVGDHGLTTMRTLAPPTGRGWEYLNGSGWDFDPRLPRSPNY